MRRDTHSELAVRSVPICVPALGGKIAGAELVDWLKAPGDTVQRGEVLFEVETDKATIAVVAVTDGRVVETTHTEGRVSVGQVVGVMSVPAVEGGVTGESGDAVVGRYEPPRAHQPRR